jgi:arylsulfatase
MILRTIFITLLCFATGNAAFAAAESGRPNILLIVADDLGYADLGVYGGDIDTPTIDALAADGMLFTQFHTAPLCSPTRAMLLTGNNNHVAGVANQGRVGAAGVAVTGYEASLSDRVVPFPKLLRDSGYDTYIAGKWHLGGKEGQRPRDAGFTRSLAMVQGGASHFDSRGYTPEGATYMADGDIVERPAGKYSTEMFTDALIEFIEADKHSGRPFMAYAAYTSPHWPLQVPDDYLDIYKGRYDDGYDALREQRFESLKEAGIIPLDSVLPPRNPEITPWEELSTEQQRRESRKMELYAAMVDNLDDHVGRLIAYLKDNDLHENTLIVFMSDNGAAAEDFYNGILYDNFREHTRATFDNAYEKMGTADSFVSYGPQWAEAGSAPFQKYKSYMREGGIVAPMIIAGRGVAATGVIDSNYATVMDLAPTFLEIAGASYPVDGAVKPILGESMAAFLSGDSDSVHGDDYVTVMSHRGRAMVRRGRWKIVTTYGPFDERNFELYDVTADPGETNNLARQEPEIYAELIDIWRTRRREFGIILPEDL